MKPFYSGLVVCLILTQSASAQQHLQVEQQAEPKAAVFTKYPGKFEIDADQLQRVFSANIKDSVTIQLSRNHQFKGVVLDKVQQSPNVTSINIRSAQFSGAMMHLSLNTAPDADQPIRGRIIHPRKGDVMVLTKEDKKYFLVKEEQQFFLAE
ncbi:hypothetical protein HHL16_07080 [Pseudoflavitalea sp. G-6-1-2]|uniref:hypothetical protein n=1 Tax=Pseudoflavitalea sp. G-6-1-2 TaxID=2728841 RepID=UPI00146A1917|nr:hypothetical protein [Pseudoflavitalea sp. G-6-1-2]NML20630.1 hypothetical protein [Pseudoflavitalea sp. G-6-1-2]